jgi:hypothetical protein
MDLEKEVFSGKKVSDIVQEIYDKQKEQDVLLKEKISMLASYIETPGDAIVMIPLIKELSDTGVKNSELLLKVLQLFKQSETKSQDSSGGPLSEKDIAQLFEELPSFNKVDSQKLIK